MKKEINVENVCEFKPMRTPLSLQDAVKESCRCLLCEDAPCSKNCPAGTDPGKFIRQIRFENYKGAARTVRNNNALGAVCAYTCPVENLCEKECTHRKLGEPININGLQAFAYEYGRTKGLEPFEKAPSKGIKVAVVGAGAAGVSCAAELAKKGFEVTIFERDEKIGGVASWGIPQYRLPNDALQYATDNLKSLGVKVMFKKNVSNRDEVANLFKEGFKAVFVGVGLSENIGLDIFKGYENTPLAGDFLRNAKKEKMNLSGKTVAVIGGGAVAMDAAVTAVAFGAKKVYTISLEGLLELPANEEEEFLARKSGVVFKTSSKVLEVSSNGKNVTGLKGIETEWKQKGNFRPDNATPIGGTEFNLKVDYVIQAIGARAGVNAKDISSVKGVFLGGDIAGTGPATIAKAVGDGKKAADEITKFLIKG